MQKFWFYLHLYRCVVYVNRMQSEKIKFLEMLQNIIARMNGNSFSIKNWFMVSVGGLIALYFKLPNVALLVLAIILTLSFFWFDAYYLWLERCYRQKYTDALADKCALFDMNIANIQTYIRMSDVLNSKSLSVYKIAFFIILILVVYYVLSTIGTCHLKL